jgi:hypothetical protein
MKFSYSEKVSIPAPKVTVKKNDDPKYYAKVKKALSRGMVKASEYIKTDLSMALDTAMTNANWSWPRQTQRKSGEIAGTSRDIIDMGNLYESQQIKEKFLKTKTTFEIIYNTPYAAIIHYGGYVQPYGNPNAATVYIPGRPWIEAAINGGNGMSPFDAKTPLEKGLAEGWREVIGT